jgi:cyclopropane-fatty-acyl-phospholipid synthase
VQAHDLLVHSAAGWPALAALRLRLFNLQTPARAPQVARAHYDLGNDFFEKMLGPTMAYSCAYWRRATDLDQAQDDKHDLICRKIQLTGRDRVLDIGCGWGGFARYAARKYGCHVIGITVSEPQQRNRLV